MTGDYEDCLLTLLNKESMVVGPSKPAGALQALYLELKTKNGNQFWLLYSHSLASQFTLPTTFS